MTDYYNIDAAFKPYVQNLEALNPGILSVYLANMSPAQLKNPSYSNTKWLQFDGWKGQTSVLASDDWIYPTGADGVHVPGLTKCKTFNWAINVQAQEMRAFVQGEARAVENIQNIIKAENEHFGRYIDTWLTTGAATSARDYDGEWKPPFKTSSGNAVGNPNDLNAAAGTDTATGVKFTGAGRATLPLESTLYADQYAMLNAYDTTTGQSIAKTTSAAGEGADPNDYLLIINNVAGRIVERARQYQGAAGFFSAQTMGQELAQAKIRMVGTTGESYTYATGNTTIIRLALNPKENFFYHWVEPFSVEPWEKIVTQTGATWRLAGHATLAAWARPYTVNGGTTWYKALRTSTIIPYATS